MSLYLSMLPAIALVSLVGCAALEGFGVSPDGTDPLEMYRTDDEQYATCVDDGSCDETEDCVCPDCTDRDTACEAE